LPDGDVVEVPGAGVIGAVQPDGKLFDRLPFIPVRQHRD
jgi:hypothetical protein